MNKNLFKVSDKTLQKLLSFANYPFTFIEPIVTNGAGKINQNAWHQLCCN